MFGIDFLTTGTLLALAAGQVQDGQAFNACPLVKPAQINIIPKMKPLKYDYKQTLAQLQSAEADTINPYGFHGVSVIQGYTQTQIGFGPIHTKLGEPVYLGRDVVCLYYDTINVPIEIDPTIVIAKEVYSDRCLGPAVIDHEMKHVNVDRDMVNTYSKIIGQKIYKALETRGFRSEPVRTADAQHMADRMYKLIHQVVETEYKRFELDRLEEQRAVDSLEEYDRTARLCPDSQMPQWATQVGKNKSKPRAYNEDTPLIYRPQKR